MWLPVLRKGPTGLSICCITEAGAHIRLARSTDGTNYTGVTVLEGADSVIRSGVFS